MPQARHVQEQHVTEINLLNTSTSHYPHGTIGHVNISMLCTSATTPCLWVHSICYAFVWGIILVPSIPFLKVIRLSLYFVPNAIYGSSLHHSR